MAVDAPAFQGRIVWVLGLLALAVFGFFAGVQVTTPTHTKHTKHQQMHESHVVDTRAHIHEL